MLDQIYGFEVKYGKYQVQRTEAKIVRLIFDEIILNKGPYMVAGLLNEKGIPTRKKNGKWTHSVISRMIRNRRYSGELGYPKIVNKSVQDKAIEALKNISLSKARRISNNRNMNSPFYKTLKCANCGYGFCLYEGSEILYWRCGADKSRSKCGVYHKWDGIADDDIHALTLEVINELIAAPQMIMNLGNSRYNKLSIVKIDNQINKLLETDAHDIEKMEQLIKEKHRIAYAQYDDDYIAETMMLIEAVKKLSIQSVVIKEVLTSLIKEIRIDETGKVSFMLLNYQVIEKHLKIRRDIAHG